MTALGAAAHADAQITSTGPLTNVLITSDLNCAVNHTGDTSGEFFGGTACGTFVAVGGVLYGPASVPAGGAATPLTPWTPVNQTAVTGSGTNLDPFTVVTTVNGVDPTSLVPVVQVVETDTYVVGQEAYRTDVVVHNLTGSSVTPVIYHAGDCFLQDSDSGFGRTYSNGAVACVAAAFDPNTGQVTGPGSRVEQFLPLTSGSEYLEDGFDQVWAALGTQQPLPNTCRCGTTPDSNGNFPDYIDNGEAISWNPTVAANGSVTESSLQSFSPTGVVPLTTSKTADSSTASAGGADGYTITITNTGSAAVTLDTITDTLPAGFTYTAGSSTGATTADPGASGQTLTWTLSGVSVAAGGNTTLHFGVTVSCTAGGYTNSAGGTAENDAVVPVSNTAPVTVSGTCGGTAPDTTSLNAGPAATQYSDPATLSATLTDTTTSGLLANVPVSFTFNSVSYPTTTNGSGVASVTVPQVLLAPNTYPFTVAYAGDSTHAASNGGNNVVVSKEDCTLSYTGALAVPTGSVTNLSAQFGEFDATHGDWSSKSVDFLITDFASNAVADPSAVTNGSGVASTTQALPAGVYTVLVRFAGDGNYNSCHSGGNDVIGVAAANALVTGGGFVLASGGHINFGFNAASTDGILSGQLQLRQGRFNFHGYSVTSLSVSGRTATWTGTGRVGTTFGYSYVISVADNRNGAAHGGTADTLSIQIKNSSGTVVYSASGSVKGGNITVHQI